MWAQGRLSVAGRERASAELHIRTKAGDAVCVFQAQRVRGRGGGAAAWRMAFGHPLSTFQAGCPGERLAAWPHPGRRHHPLQAPNE